MKPLRVGIVGTGNISGIYLENLQRYATTEVIACADLDGQRAGEAARRAGLENGLAPEDLIAHPEVELVLNLTPPSSHGAIALAAVAAGKHVYNEKPLAIEFGDARALLVAAERHGVRVGGAPDTFLGAAHQAAREIVDSGRLGKIVAVHGFMLCSGHESWHPNPAYYYERGGGPLFDMGPYYITAFANMLGAVKRVSGAAATTFPEREITSEPLRGAVIKVETPTHVSGTMEFSAGAIGQLTTSFDAGANVLPRIVVTGSEGAMLVPDPNGFGGAVRTKLKNDAEWTDQPTPRPFSENSRGVGVAEMATAIRENRPHRASGELALHVLEVMHATLRSAQSGRHIGISTRISRPAPLPDDWAG